MNDETDFVMGVRFFCKIGLAICAILALLMIFGCAKPPPVEDQTTCVVMVWAGTFAMPMPMPCVKEGSPAAKAIKDDTKYEYPE